MLFEIGILSLQLVSGKGVDVDIGKVQACPRCRRIEPKGPKKRPHPDYTPGWQNPKKKEK